MSEIISVIPPEVIAAWEAAQRGKKRRPIGMDDLDRLLRAAQIGASLEEAVYFLAQLNRQAETVFPQLDNPDLLAEIEGVEPTTHNPALANSVWRQQLRPDEVRQWNGDPKELFDPDFLDAQGYVEVPVGDGELP